MSQPHGDTTTMVYGMEDRLSVHAHFDAGIDQVQTVTYTYEGDGLKRAEVTAGSRTTLMWDGDDYLGEKS